MIFPLDLLKSLICSSILTSKLFSINASDDALLALKYLLTFHVTDSPVGPIKRLKIFPDAFHGQIIIFRGGIVEVKLKERSLLLEMSGEEGSHSVGEDVTVIYV
jgi:hypothetical protein